MADIKKSILKIIKSFTQEIMDNEPNKDSYLDEYFIALNDLYENAQAHLQTFNTIVDGIEESNKIIDASYKNQLEKIEDNIRRDKGYTRSNAIFEINNLENLISNEEVLNEKTIKKNNDEKLLTTSQTNPVISSHFRQRNATIEICNKNEKKITDTYNVLVNKMTKERDQRNLDIARDNNLFMNTYESASNNVIKSFDDKILIFQKDIDSIDDEIERLKSRYNHDCLEIEKRFNTEVIAFQQTAKAKTKILTDTYNNEKQNINNKREDQRNKNQDERSQVFKEFVHQIHSLNDKIDKFDADQKAHLYDSTLIYNLKIFDFDKQIRRINEQIYKENNRKNIKELNKQIHQIEDNKRKETLALKLKSDVIKRFYKPRLLDYSNRKIIYEDIKNQQLEKLNLITNIEDNAHHNKLAMLQLQYDYDVETINRETEKKIHELRTAYDQEKIKINEIYKISLTKLYIKKQEFINNVNLAQNELELAKRLNKLVNENAKKILENKISRSSTEALLEIEKNDILREYNSQYIKNQIDKEKALYDYNEQNEFLHRDKKNQSVDFATERSRLALTHNKAIYSFQIELEVLKEEYINNLRSTKYSELITTASANNTYTLFTNRKKIILALYNTSKDLILDIIKTLQFISKKTASVRVTTQTTPYYIKTLREIYNITNLACCKILDTVQKYVLSLIDDQINFETGSKYQTRYNSLQTEFDTKFELLEDRKKDLQTTIDNYNNTNRIFYNSLGNVQSKLSSFNHRLKRGEITKIYYRRETYGLKTEAKRIHMLITKNDERIEKLQSELNKIPQKLEYIQKEYQLHKLKIQNEQKAESGAFFKGIQDIKDYFDNLKKGFANITNLVSSEGVDYIKFIKKVEKVSGYYANRSNKLMLQFLNLINDLDTDISSRYDNLINKNQLSYDKQIKIIKRLYQRNTSKLNQSIENENNKYADLMKNHKERLEAEIKRYDDLIADNKNNYNKKVNDLNQTLHRQYEEYLVRSASTRQNILQNIYLHNKIEERLKDENSRDNSQLVKKYIGYKDMLIHSNNEKLLSFDLSIKNIPYESHMEVLDSEQKLSMYLKEFELGLKEYEVMHIQSRKNIEDETKRYAANLQNKIGICNQAISKGRKAIASRS